jgi:acetoin utilization deacetylase AcuC-like enzyme
VRLFYSSDYTAASVSFDTTRKSGWIAESLSSNPIPGVEIVAPTPLTFQEIAEVHDAPYVKSIRRGEPKHLAESQGFTWDPGMWKAVTASNGGVVAAANAAMTDGVSGSLSSGLHHAQQSRGAAFCTFNGLVIAARKVLAQGARTVLILDLDSHCGGGTHSLIENDNRIRQVDVSLNSVDAYWSSGSNTLDIIRDVDKYLPTIGGRLGELGHFDLCLYNSGMDPDERCEAGGFPGITAEILRQREQLVFSWAKQRGIPIAFVLAGGYCGAALTQESLVKLHRLTIASAQG